MKKPTLTSPSIHFIVSSKAGGGQPLAYVQTIKHVWHDAGRSDEIAIHLTQNAQDAKAFAAAIIDESLAALARKGDESRATAKLADSRNTNSHKAKGQTPIVWVLGGDGTLGEVATALALHRADERPADFCPALGVVPVGSANDFARQLYQKAAHTPDAVLKSRVIERIIQGTLDVRFHQLDLIKFTCDDEQLSQAISLNIMGFGFDSQVLKRAYTLMQKTPLGVSACYNAATLWGISMLAPTTINVRFTDKTGEQTDYRDLNMLLFTICNSGFYGDGYAPFPSASISDGSLDLMWCTPLSRRAFIKLAQQYKLGTHLADPKVSTASGVTEVSIETSNGSRIPANSDGTLLNISKLHAKIMSDAVVLAVPQGIAVTLD